MQKKIYVLIVTLMLCSIAIVIVPDDIIVKATGEGEGESGIGLDFQLIYNVTSDLSEVINVSYNPELGELAKGRAFGTTGEHFAALQIIKPKMIEILGESNVSHEQMENIDTLSGKLDNPTTKLEIQSFGITVNDEGNGTNKTVGEFHIRPQWDLTGLRILENNSFPILTLLGFNIFNTSMLTRNISHVNLSIKHRPTNWSWYWNFIFDNITDILNSSEDDFPASFPENLFLKFEEYHNFTFDELNPDNASTNLEWYSSQWAPLRGDNDPFVFIGEDPAFNPNSTTIYPTLEYIIEKFLELLPDEHWLDSSIPTIESSL